MKNGKKKSDLRFNDHDFQIDDILILEEYDDTDFTTGRMHSEFDIKNI